MVKHCEAVELLLARMDSNPEEFRDGGRWEGLIIKYRSYLPVQDRTAMEDKINSLRLDTFHKDVMNELLAEPNDDAVARAAYTTTPTSNFPTGIAAAVPRTTGTTTIGVSPYTNAANINLSEGSIKSIAAALGAYANANVWKP
jgi:hypothetical protein